MKNISLTVSLQLLSLLLLVIPIHSDQLNLPKLSLSFNQSILAPLKSLLPQSFTSPQPRITSARITTLTNNHTHISTSKLCHILREPNHQPYYQIQMLPHKIKENKTEWMRVMAEEGVVFRLEDIGALWYALDMEVVGGVLAVVFEDGETIFYNKTHHDNRTALAQVSRTKACGLAQGQYLQQGKIAVVGQTGLFISPQCLSLINPTLPSMHTLQGYQPMPHIYGASLSTSQFPQPHTINIYLANGKKGIRYYTLRDLTDQLTKIADIVVKVGAQKVMVADIVDVSEVVHSALGERVFLVLDPRRGMLKVVLPSQGSLSEVQATQTAMNLTNCRLLTLHNKQILTSCPQVLTYNPNTDTLQSSPILSPLPLQLLPSGRNLAIISHNSFQIVTQCSGTPIQQGLLNGESFHHTVNFGEFFVSVDDLAVYVWGVREMGYYLECRADGKFEGDNLLGLQVGYQCDNGMQGNKECCIKNFRYNLFIFDSQLGLHVFQILITVFLVVTSTIAGLYLLWKRKQIYQQYGILVQQSVRQEGISQIHEQKQSQNSQKERHKVNPTQESIVMEEDRDKKVDKKIQEHIQQ